MVKGKGRGEAHFSGRERAALAREKQNPEAEIKRRADQARAEAAERDRIARDAEAEQRRQGRMR